MDLTGDQTTAVITSAQNYLHGFAWNYDGEEKDYQDAPTMLFSKFLYV